MGRVGRTFVAGFDAVVMASAAYIQMDGRVTLTPAGIVLWGSAVAAALCALVVWSGGASLVAWGAIGFVLFGALLTAGGPHWPLLAFAVALMPLVPRPRGSLWVGLGFAGLFAAGASLAIAAVM
ncbi:MAG TPA: hypothetical protein VFM06_04755 [Candidatus Limnocylindria bacterium]|nr:hypothetical protein [Candidatus Limnocylindria bacterium]